MHMKFINTMRIWIGTQINNSETWAYARIMSMMSICRYWLLWCNMLWKQTCYVPFLIFFKNIKSDVSCFSSVPFFLMWISMLWKWIFTDIDFFFFLVKWWILKAYRGEICINEWEIQSSKHFNVVNDIWNFLETIHTKKPVLLCHLRLDTSSMEKTP